MAGGSRMRLEVRLLAMLREAVGDARVALELREETTVAEKKLGEN